MSIRTHIPDAGDIININFNPQAGSEQAGRRPALVLSPKAYSEKTGLAVVCPITNKAKGYPFEVPLPQDLGVTGVILVDHVKSLALEPRDAQFRCKAPQDVLDDVRGKLGALLGTQDTDS